MVYCWGQLNRGAPSSNGSTQMSTRKEGGIVRQPRSGPRKDGRRSVRRQDWRNGHNLKLKRRILKDLWGNRDIESNALPGQRGASLLRENTGGCPRGGTRGYKQK